MAYDGGSPAVDITHGCRGMASYSTALAMSQVSEGKGGRRSGREAEVAAPLVINPRHFDGEGEWQIPRSASWDHQMLVA